MKAEAVEQEKGINLVTLRKIYGTFGPHLRDYWPWLVIAYAGLIGTVLMKVVKPWPLKLVFDYVLLDRPVPEGVARFISFLGSDKLALLTAFSVGIVIVVFLSGLFSYTKRYFTAVAGRRVTNDIRRRVFDHLQYLPQSFHGTSRSGDIVLRLTSDIDSLKNLLIKFVETFLGQVLTFAGIILTMLWMDWQLTLVALAVIPPLYLMSLRLSEKVDELSKVHRDKESEVASLVQETISSTALIQAFTQEKQERERFKKVSEESLAADLKKMRLARMFGRAVELVTAIGMASVVWFGGKRALEGDISPGDLIVFAAYLRDLYSPIGNFSELVMDFASSLVRGERIADILKTDITVKDLPGAIPAPRFKGEIRFDRVTFGYKPGEPVLKDLSFTVRPGQMVALMGSSGTGKSTVVNLLLRFYDPWDGRILIDGEDIRRFQLKSLRSEMSVVLQDPILFHRSIRENIAYGKPAARLEEIVAAASAAQAHEFIMKLPHGYETILDERGRNLSGGQKQRITIARAALRDAPILILDEPATGLDAVTESQLREALSRLVRGKTTFVIAHRLFTVKEADLIVVIEDGKVVEQGNHEELLVKSAIYQNLYNLQQAI